MIICFSGTGNTRMLADRLHDLLGDEIIRFSPGFMTNPSRIRLNVTDERVIWMWPVHGWGLPKIIPSIIKHAHISGPKGQPIDHYCIISCGDDIGYADQQWRHLVEQRGWKAVAEYSVQMPNVYTFMKGFDVDDEALAKDKLEKSENQIQQIAQWIAEKKPMTKVTRGKMPWLKSKIAYPWFMRYKTRTKPFAVTAACNGCGRCARNCPLTNIKLEDGHPQWGNTCTMCLRCYHCCPQHAVAYGKATKGKGQYLCPGYSILK